jgi:hypothetical protein
MGKIIRGKFPRVAEPDVTEKVTRKKFSRAASSNNTTKIIRGKFSQAARDDYFDYNTTKRSGKWCRKTDHRDIKKLPLPDDVNSVQFYTRHITNSDRDIVKKTHKSPIYYIGGQIIENGQYVRTRRGEKRRLTNHTRVVNNNLDLIWSPEQ